MRKHIITSGGKVLLIEDMTEEHTSVIAREFFDQIGGADFFVGLATVFYRLVHADPVIGPLFRDSPEHDARRLADHFIRMYGTPDLSEGWDQRFLWAHLHSVIGNRHRRRWLELMRAAGTEVDAAEPWFSDFMSTLINASGAVSAASRGAALVRGLELDREGEVVESHRSGAGPEEGAAPLRTARTDPLRPDPTS
jgi:truncated hemoglobin YjbI